MIYLFIGLLQSCIHMNKMITCTIATHCIPFIILLLVCNRARYWSTAVGSDTVFYSNDCYKLQDKNVI